MDRRPSFALPASGLQRSPFGGATVWTRGLRRAGTIVLALLAAFATGAAVMMLGIGLLDSLGQVGLTAALPGELLGNFGATLILVLLVAVAGLATLAPILLPIIIVVESRRANSLRMHLTVAGVLGGSLAAMFAIGPDGGVSRDAEALPTTAFLVAGALAGSVIYWRLAGARAGLWLDPPEFPHLSQVPAGVRVDVHHAPEALSVGLVLANAATMFASDARERSVRLRVVPTTLTIEVDALALLRAIGEMLTVAIEARGTRECLLGGRRRDGGCDIELWVAAETPIAAVGTSERELDALAARMGGRFEQGASSNTTTRLALCGLPRPLDGPKRSG